jgi:hypothetical protein
MRARAPLLFLLATTGCFSEYHSDVHPVTVTTVVQNAPAPVVSVTADATPALDPPEPHEPVDVPTRGTTYLGPGVSIGPGVSFGGDVYVSGDLIIGGTRENPQLNTR